MTPEKGSFPKADPQTRELFESLLPEEPRISVRPMFGNLAAFVNGNMFSGVFGDEIFVRLDQDGRAELLETGGGEFAPMPGRAMREYGTLPPSWRDDADLARKWLERSLDVASELPPKATR